MNNNCISIDDFDLSQEELDLLENTSLDDLMMADHPSQTEADRNWLRRLIRAKEYILAQSSVISNENIFNIDTKESLNDRFGRSPNESVLITNEQSSTNPASPTNGLACASEHKRPTAEPGTNGVSLPIQDEEILREPSSTKGLETGIDTDDAAEVEAEAEADDAWGGAHWLEVHLWNNWGNAPYNQRPSPKSSPTKYRAKVFFNYRSSARTYNPSDFLLCDFTNRDKWIAGRPGGDAHKAWYDEWWGRLYEDSKGQRIDAQPILVGHLREGKQQGQSGTKRYPCKSAMPLMDVSRDEIVVLVADGCHTYEVRLYPTIGGKVRNADWKGEWLRQQSHLCSAKQHRSQVFPICAAWPHANPEYRHVAKRSEICLVNINAKGLRMSPTSRGR